MKKYAAHIHQKPARLSTLESFPAHWDELSVRHLLLGIKDGTHGTFNRVPDGEPLLSAKNVWESGLRYSEADSQISEADHRKIVSNGYPKKDDVLLTIVGTIGRVCVYEEERPLAFQRSVCFLRFRESGDSKYFYYFAQSKFFLEQLTMSSKASAQAGIYMGDVASSIATRPPLSQERWSIVSLLDRETARIDALIEKKTRFIELLKEKCQALITQAVTKGLDPTVPMKDSGVEWIGEVPAHWEVGPVKHQATIFGRIGFRGYTVSDIVDGPESGAITLSPGNIYDHELNLAKVTYLSWAKYHESPEIQIREADILMVKTGSTLGKTCLVKELSQPATLNPQLVVFKNVKSDPRYFAYSLQGAVVQAVVAVSNSGGSTPTMTQETIGSFPMVVPSYDQQFEIANEIERQLNIHRKLERAVTQSIELLKERRSALITAAVTGQIDLRKESA